MGANIGWRFYREIYAYGNNETHIAKVMNDILKAKNTDEETLHTAHSFRMETTYPGLLIGSGYTHGISSDSDAKIGFYFDHTTGLPQIPGSSVKGVLRSLFGLSNTDEVDPFAKEKATLIRTLLDKNDLDVYALAREIFEGVDQNGKLRKIYRRDRFYEARIVKVDRELFLDDYITPHHPDLLKNPIPIRFIKVALGVTFEFRFDLVDGLIDADEKLILFAHLLQWHGVGAKTNVGYGQFKPLDIDVLVQKLQRDKINARIANASGIDKLILEVEKLSKAESIFIKIKDQIDELTAEDKLRVMESVDTRITNRSDKWYKNIRNKLTV